jgi:hypothetical protein
VRIDFKSEEEAVAFCEDQGFDYVIEGTKPYERKHQSYADNFQYSGKSKVKQFEEKSKTF